MYGSHRLAFHPACELGLGSDGMQACKRVASKSAADEAHGAAVLPGSRARRTWAGMLHAPVGSGLARRLGVKPAVTQHGGASRPVRGAGRRESAREGAAARCARLARYTLRRGRVVAALLGRLATLPEAVVRAARRPNPYPNWSPRSSALSSAKAAQHERLRSTCSSHLPRHRCSWAWGVACGADPLPDSKHVARRAGRLTAGGARRRSWRAPPA